MTEPSLLQVAFAHLLLACTFAFGTYATAWLFQWVRLTRILFWVFIAAVYAGVVLPLLLVVAGVAAMEPAAPTANVLAMATNIGLSTLIGTVSGVRQWQRLGNDSGN
jgi:hypothetical protein